MPFVKYRCSHCGSTQRIERHHVTYVPELIVPLCHKDHKKVTELNTQMARKFGRKLSNEERRLLFGLFMLFNRK